MTVLFQEMTRKQLGELAPRAIAVLPTSATEQHGPHMAVGTDTLLVTTIAERAAQQAADEVPVVVTPPLAFGSSHHHYPFGATLSLTSEVFSGVIRDVLTGLVRCGFQRLIVINGHGGNKDLVGAVAQDFVHRRGEVATIASCNYWDVAMPALVKAELFPAGRVPGHAGHYETSAVLALRPDWVDEEARAQVTDMSTVDTGLDVNLTGAVVQTYGAWGKGPGHTDNPAAATAELGRKALDIIVPEVARFFRDFQRTPLATRD